jgi:hypothetical protein
MVGAGPVNVGSYAGLRTPAMTRPFTRSGGWHPKTCTLAPIPAVRCDRGQGVSSTHLRHSYRRQHRHDWEIGAKMRQAAEAAVRPDEDRAAPLSASVRSTGGLNRLCGRDARSAVAQDARGGDPSLATTRNPVNFGLRASGRRALLAFTTWFGRIRSGSTRRDRDPHFNSDACGLGHILLGSKTI